jgi:mono/diheme cytochrome c family protein
MRLNIFLSIFVISGLIFLSSCGGDKKEVPESKSQSAEVGSDLTEFELENGIGPIKEKLELGPIDPKLVKRGEEIWNQKCVACHKLDERYVGPAQRDLIKRRTPEFIMNMILNPEEMEKRHPVVKQLLAEYMTPMTNQNLTIEDARALLEFFREIGK